MDNVIQTGEHTGCKGRTHGFAPTRGHVFASTIHIDFRPINHVRCDEGLLEFRLDAAQAFLGLHAVAEIAGAQAEIWLHVGQVDGNVGESLFKLAFYGFGMVT